MRRIALLVLVGSLVSCSHSGSSGVPSSTGPLQAGPLSGSAALGAGQQVGRFTILALDPSKQPFTVTVRKPRRADVSVTVDTAYRAVLHIFDSVDQSDACRPGGAGVVCRLSFPILEAQHGGQWTVVVRKRSQAPATVGVAFHFG